MCRIFQPVFVAATCGLLLALPLCADDPPKKLTPEERKELEAKWKQSAAAAVKAGNAGKLTEATRGFEDALAVAWQLYPPTEYPDGHAVLIQSLRNLARVLEDRGKFADAEPHFREIHDLNKKRFPGDHRSVADSANDLASILHDCGKLDQAEKLYLDSLDMRKRLFKGDHVAVADSLNNLAVLYRDQSKLTEAEALFRDALDMTRRLVKGDHPDVSDGLNNLASVLQDRGKLAEAEPLFREALAMTRRMFKGDHQTVAGGLNNLAGLVEARGNAAEAERLYREALEMRQRLHANEDHPTVATSLGNVSGALKARGKYAEAEQLARDALAMNRRLFKHDHPNLAKSLNNLSSSLQDMGKFAEAESISREALAMRQRLYKGDHPEIAQGMSNVATLLWHTGHFSEAEFLLRNSLEMRQRLFPKQPHPSIADVRRTLGGLMRTHGKYTEAETHLRAALEMRQQLFKGDHPKVAGDQAALATVLLLRDKDAEAEELCRAGLEMRQRLFPKQDHPAVANSLSDLGMIVQERQRFGEAEPLHREALEMRQRLFKGDHTSVAAALNNLATVLKDQGKLADAELLYRDALAMDRRLRPAEHNQIAIALYNMAFISHAQGKHTEAEPFHRDAMRMYRTLLERYAATTAEGEALTYLASVPTMRDGYLANALAQKADAATVYPEIWADKSAIARVVERRQLAARAAATDPRANQLLTELSDHRRRRAELILAPRTEDTLTRKTRDAEIKKLTDRVAELDRELRPILPVLERSERLATATPADLQKVLPVDAAVVDFLVYLHFEYDPKKPGKQGESRTERYLAFVVTKEKVAWVELGTADKIEDAVTTWREAITSGKDIPAAIPAKVRELIWEKVRKELPANVKTVFVTPDLALCRVPWAALPGDKPGTILLEDFAVATIPHAVFLLDKLWPQEALKNPPSGALVVGGVNYEAEATTGPNNRDLPIKPGTQAAWTPLPGAAAEAAGVTTAASNRKLGVTSLKADSPTPAAVLAALPKAKFAHIATHGFFADATFRSAFRLDPKEFKQSWQGERIGRAAQSPLVMTGLVLAGANNPKTAGRGIVTGESLIDLDLSGLELAVLSACETGLGDVAGGEGTFGLQRAFHLAGTRDVIASLWKVPDAPTAALMAEFYRNMWEKNQTPLAALREAQLTIYRNPGKIAELAAGFRAGFKEVPGSETAIKPTADGKAHPRLWAAFTLSGPGR